MLLVINPAPTSRAHDRATSPMTRILLIRPALKLDDPRPSSFRIAFTSARPICREGAAPDTSAVTTVIPITNRRIGTSTMNSMK